MNQRGRTKRWWQRLVAVCRVSGVLRSRLHSLDVRRRSHTVSSNIQSFFEEVAELPDFCGISPIGLHTRGHFGDTPLHVAAIRGDVAMIAALLDAGADIGVPGEHGYTPLHEAVSQGHLEAVRLLLARGASTTIVSKFGETPVQLAHSLEHREIESLMHDPAA